MKLSYKALATYIEPVNQLNDGMEVKELLGISNQKFFQNSHTNTIDIDLQTYRIVRTNQFAYNRATTRNGDKISIALRQGNDCIVSPSYRIFRSKDENALNSEYLMMWFRRPEFDRYARFKSHGSAHEFFEYDQMCQVELPIPHIDKQREIVKEYNVIQNRIALNQQLIQKLEETAQAIYKQWFVEGIDLENLPEGWKEKRFTEVVKLSGGGTPDTNNVTFWNGNIPFFTPADVSSGYYSIQTEKTITGEGLKNSSTKLYPKNTVFVTARGTVGAISISGCEMAMNQSCYALTGKCQFFIHQLAIETMNKLKTEAVGAVFGALVTKNFDAQMIIEPPTDMQNDFENKVSKLYVYILFKTKENQKLTELKELLLSKLATVE